MKIKIQINNVNKKQIQIIFLFSLINLKIQGPLKYKKTNTYEIVLYIIVTHESAGAIVNWLM